MCFVGFDSSGDVGVPRGLVELPGTVPTCVGVSRFCGLECWFKLLCNIVSLIKNRCLGLCAVTVLCVGV